MNYFYFILSVLVVWRLTHLLSKEDGPFNVIFIIRKKQGQVSSEACLTAFIV